MLNHGLTLRAKVLIFLTAHVVVVFGGLGAFFLGTTGVVTDARTGTTLANWAFLIVASGPLYLLAFGVWAHHYPPIIRLLSVILQCLGMILAFAGVYGDHGFADAELPILRSDALYFSIVTWTTLGYGDFQPVEDLRLFAAYQAFVGYVYMGVLAGVVVSIWGRRD